MDNTFKRRLAIALICILALMVGCIAQVHASEKTDGKNVNYPPLNSLTRI